MHVGGIKQRNQDVYVKESEHALPKIRLGAGLQFPE